MVALFVITALPHDSSVFTSRFLPIPHPCYEGDINNQDRNQSEFLTKLSEKPTISPSLTAAQNACGVFCIRNGKIGLGGVGLTGVSSSPCFLYRSFAASAKTFEIP